MLQWDHRYRKQILLFLTELLKFGRINFRFLQSDRGLCECFV